VPRAGPLRYWSLTLLGLIILLGCLFAFGWGLWNLLQTGTCSSGGPYVSARECPDDTGWHILAVTLAPFVAPLGIVAWAFRGGSNKSWIAKFRPRRKRLADQIARGEAAMPTVRTPPPQPPVPSQTPLNSTWPPATWSPKPQSQSPPPPAAAAPSELSPVERLNQLSQMKDRGLISPEEFEAEKKQILGGI
jgi:hypothetical protein